MKTKRIVITTGDVDGVGLEVTAKALEQIGPKRGVHFFVMRSPQKNSRFLKLVDKKFLRAPFSNLNDALYFSLHERSLAKNILFDIESDLGPARWVESATKACLLQSADALVTGPLSKTTIKNEGLKDLGHTDILKRLSKAKTVKMGFVGEHFNVVLATGHIPLSQVSTHLNFKSLCEALELTNSLRLKLPLAKRKKPIGLLGLNPHAGEDGLIGHEEQALFKNLSAFAQEQSIPIEGPLVPDAAFLPKNWPRYSSYLALYHDQGLIPFKAIHGQDSGVHISLGIPFVRTSVDHGTAKDIFNKNKAHHGSMKDALLWALMLTN